MILAELRARVHNILEVRLLHLKEKSHCKELEETVRELEESREIIRLQTLEERKAEERELALARETQRSLLPRSLPQFENYRIYAFNRPTEALGGISSIFRKCVRGSGFEPNRSPRCR